MHKTIYQRKASFIQIAKSKQQSVATNEKIISSILARENIEDDDELQLGDIDFDIEGPKRSSWDELEVALDAIQNASLSSSQHGEEINSLVMRMQNFLRCAKRGQLCIYYKVLQLLWNALLKTKIQFLT